MIGAFVLMALLALVLYAAFSCDERDRMRGGWGFKSLGRHHIALRTTNTGIGRRMSWLTAQFT